MTSVSWNQQNSRMFNVPLSYRTGATYATTKRAVYKIFETTLLFLHIHSHPRLCYLTWYLNLHFRYFVCVIISVSALYIISNCHSTVHWTLAMFLPGTIYVNSFSTPSCYRKVFAPSTKPSNSAHSYSLSRIYNAGCQSLTFYLNSPGTDHHWSVQRRTIFLQSMS